MSQIPPAPPQTLKHPLPNPSSGYHPRKKHAWRLKSHPTVIPQSPSNVSGDECATIGEYDAFEPLEQGCSELEGTHRFEGLNLDIDKGLVGGSSYLTSADPNPQMPNMV
jgi:hypothetical protein